MIPISLLPSEHHLLIIYFYMNPRCEDSAPLNYPPGEEGQREMSIQSVPLFCSGAAWALSEDSEAGSILFIGHAALADLIRMSY